MFPIFFRSTRLAVLEADGGHGKPLGRGQSRALIQFRVDQRSSSRLVPQLMEPGGRYALSSTVALGCHTSQQNPQRP